MGSRYKEEKPFAFYDPERDREGQSQAPRRKSAPLSPRAQPSGHSYPMSSSPREQPFGHYDPDLDRDRDRHGTSYGPELRASPTRLDSRPGVGRGAPPPYINQDSGPLPMSHGHGRGAPEPASYAGRGAPEPGYGGRRSPEPAGYPGRGAPEPEGYPGRGAPEPAIYAGRRAPEPAGYGGRGAPEPASYGGRGAPETAGYPGRGAPEPGSYGGRGAYPPDFAGASGRGRGYGDGEPGYARPGRAGQMVDDLGRGASMAPMGAGRYVYGGLQQQQPERAGFENEYGSQPAPIGSEYAHQVYASVFSDPVYSGAGQVNSRAGYSEEPRDAQQVHHKEDVLRHPDQF